MSRIIPAIAMVLGLCITMAEVNRAEAQYLPSQSDYAQAVNLATYFKSGNFNGRLPYRYFEPTTTGNAKHPVILYLHGEGEAGTDNSAQLTTTMNATVWMEPRHQAENPAYILAPQIPQGTDWTKEPVYSSTLALLDQFIKTHPRADTNRIYLVGFSMGGTGLWNMLLKNPKLFAAAMPINGSADEWLSDYPAWTALKHTPVIILHDYDDPQVSVTAAWNAAGALQAAGNTFSLAGGPTPSIWTPGSTPSPHDAWYTAFEKFEVIYYSLFWGDLGKTRNGELNPTTLYTHRDLGGGVVQVWDYALGTSLVVERGNKAAIIDTTMGQIGVNGGLYHYIRDHVLKNKSADMEVFITHDHGDHITGLRSFIGAAQLKKVYVHQADSAAVKRMLGPDAGKVQYVKDGDLIPLGGKNIEIINVPGHTLGSIIMRYENMLFSGDTIGTGYVGVSRISIEDYVNSLQHLLNKMGKEHFIIYGGHTGELTAALNERYVQDLLTNAKAIVSDPGRGTPYWRSAELATRKVSTVGRSAITYYLYNIKRIKGALYWLDVSKGELRRGVRWGDQGFLSHVSYYRTTVDNSVSSFDITPTVLDADYKSLTVNGNATKSGEPYTATLNNGNNRFAIVVTAADGATRTYTLDVVRAN